MSASDRIGLLFAGQGSQKVGMGKDFYENSETFREIFNLLTEEQKRLAFEGPEEELSNTVNTQPIMVAFAAGVMSVLRKVLEETGKNVQMAAGLSLGEYSALHAAGVFTADDAVRLVSLRARAMNEASRGIECKMSAVMGLNRDVISECCREATESIRYEETDASGECCRNYPKVVQIANMNCPGQIVIAGEARAVEKAEALLAEHGAKRCMPLKVSGPFHTVYMESAGRALEEAFKTVTFGKMEYPVIHNAVGRSAVEDETVQELLVKQVSGCVYFEDSIREMKDAGINTVIEIGPGKALSGFVRKTVDDIEIMNIETWDDFLKVSAKLKGEE